MLFEPLQIRDVVCRNRLVVSPMCQYSSTDGYANDWHLVHLGSRAVGGAGLVFTEATAVSPEGRISPQDLGIWQDGHIEMLQRIAGFITGQGAVPGIQLAHAGRKASTSAPWQGGQPLTAAEGGWQTVAPSALAFKEGWPLPTEMSSKAIDKVVADFVSAAKRALQAGFKVAEIHAAHGYLINEFLSPISNHRTDGYGGSFEGRARLLIEVVDAVRQVWPQHLPLFVRISATDWVADGFTGVDAVKLANLLHGHGVDLIDCSTGGNSPHQQIPVAPLYQVPFAQQIKEGSDILTGAVGLITTAEEAESILKNGYADLVFMARQMLRNPYFAADAAHACGQEAGWPKQYGRAKKG